MSSGLLSLLSGHLKHKGKMSLNRYSKAIKLLDMLAVLNDRVFVIKLSRDGAICQRARLPSLCQNRALFSLAPLSTSAVSS